MIAAGGIPNYSYTSPDVSNGTFFLTSLEGVYRLSCGIDCAIGVPPPVPEPETYAMLLAGLGLLGFMVRRRKELAV